MRRLSGEKLFGSLGGARSTRHNRNDLAVDWLTWFAAGHSIALNPSTEADNLSTSSKGS